MKNCILEEIQILSTTERKAKKVILDPRRNLILGTNNTGKSSLIKTIYYTFGAEPQTQHPKWKKLSPVSYVKFNIEGVKYSILRNGKFFALFDSHNNVIDTFESIVSGLGPKLAELFDFKIQLPNRQGQLITPPPAFLFLPYYLDQDTGWTKEWNSFKGMGMIPGKKDPIIKYHIGQRTNEYYIAKNEKDLIVQQISEYENEREFSKDIVDKINEKLTQVDFDINLDDFKQEVEELLLECQSLKKIEDKYKITIIDLYNSKSNIEEQVLITLKALQESEKDYDYATETLNSEEVECPTCGASYDNSFQERFDLAKDEDRCEELLIELRADLAEVNYKVNKTNLNISVTLKEIQAIEGILNQKKGQIKLRDLIENEGKRELKKVFDDSIRSLLSQITEAAYKLEKLEAVMKDLEDKKKREKLYSTYRENMRKYLHELSVGSLTHDDYKDLTKSIPETGSTKPRVITAYYFSIIDLVRKYTSSVFCPIIIDSPNQQAQDSENISKILNFIKKNQPKDSQLILGLENTFDVEFDCNTIELKEKYHLLQEDDFEEVSETIMPLIHKSLYNNSDLSRLL